MAKTCLCKYFVRAEDQYIPDYSRTAGSGDLGMLMVAVVQYECICCGRRMGWLPVGSRLVHKPLEHIFRDTMEEET